ncbi:MAG TPA: stage II sporulation protein M [Candidatus Dormibacteraeota bacterium]|nr:stage II sporulation protein M [Candidatus Dormibacteraeota bacterium]
MTTTAGLPTRLFRRFFVGVRPPRPGMVRLVAGRDLRESVSDIRLLLAMTSLTFVIPLLAAGGVTLAGGFLGPNGRGITERLVEVGAFFVVFLPASFSLVLALESFSGERERNTLEMLFATPLRESEIYLGKIGAVLLPSLSLSYSALVVYTVAAVTFLRYLPTAELPPLVVVTLAQALVMVSGATIVSSQTKTLRSANVMASFIILPMSAVIQGESVLIISRLEWVLWGVAAALAVVATLLLRLGIAGFNRESILAKESRPPNPRAVSRAIRAFRPDLDLRRLPREVGGALRRTRGAIAAAALLLLAGIALGVAAEALRLVPSRPVADIVGSEVALVPQVVDGSPAALFAAILVRNAFAGWVMAAVAPFTLGVLGGLFVMANGFIFGYVGGAYAGLGPHGLTSFACGVAPHGIVELPALVLAAGFALRVGAGMVRPAPDGWLAGMRLALADYLRGMTLWLPLFAIAAGLEAFVTPSLMRSC